ncbi:golgin subfamily A member 2-like [Perognathus longimembris pacificus]|uniref:golgin subfamily A member 2-like n=1 Tax=Perognathus longimembris pacificus TaxID=214514 RepID=UPI00201867CC|nr:golgin subfamily A member 2-like [Perognathus longimembris pacificus]
MWIGLQEQLSSGLHPLCLDHKFLATPSVISHFSLTNGMPDLGPHPYPLLPNSPGIPSVGLHHSQPLREVEVAEWCQRKSISDRLGMWRFCLACCPRARRSEQSRENETAAANQRRQENQQNCPASAPAQLNTKKKPIKGDHPKRNTTGYGQSTEPTAKKHASPEPVLPLCSWRPSSRVESLTAPKNTEELQRHYQHLLLTLHSRKLRNQQLSSELHQLKKEKKHLQHEHRRENCRRAQENEALQTELEAHKLAIQMLVSEEPNLRCALARIQLVVKEKLREQEGSFSHHPPRHQRAAQQHVGQQEIALSPVTTQRVDTQKKKLQLLEDQEKSRISDLEEINSELQRKLEVLWTQKLNMQSRIQKLQKASEERAVLKRQVDNLRRVVKTMRSERDNVAMSLRRESALWEDMVREHLAELQPPAGPAQAAQQLQTQALQMQDELKDLKQQLQSQLQENHSLRLQNLEQQERLWRLEQAAEEAIPRPAKDRDTETATCTHVQDREMQDQLAQLHDAAYRLSAEKEELASALSAEQILKKQLQEKLEQQEKDFQKWKEVAKRASQEAQELQELQGQYRTQLQELRATCDQHTASNRQLSSEKEALQEHLQRQTQLLEQLKQEQIQSTLLAQTEREQLQDTLQCLEAAWQQNEQLQAKLSVLGSPPEGQGVSNAEERGEEATPLDVTVPDDVESPQVMRDFYQNALSAAEAKEVKLRQQLLEQQRKQDTQVPKRELQICFSPDLPDKVDFQSAADGLQQRCSRLSEHIAAIENSLIACREQIETLETLHQEKWEQVDLLSQEKQKKKQELQELLLQLAGKVVTCQDKMQGDTEPPAADTTSDLAGPMKTECSKEDDGSKDYDVEPSTVEAEVPCPLEPSTTQLGGMGNERPITFWCKLKNMMNIQ